MFDKYFSGNPDKAMTEDEVDQQVEEWHCMDTDYWDMIGQPDLIEWLGWSTDEYKRWFEHGTLPKPEVGH